MEPVILIVAVTAILSGTYIRAKKINLEKERMRLLATGGSLPIDESKKEGLDCLGGAKQAMPTVPIATKAKEEEIAQLRRRMENLETIVIAESEGGLVNGTAQRVKEELSEISQKLNQLER